MSTLPAIASVLFGNMMGAVLVSSRSQQQQCRWMVIAGLTLAMLGYLWNIIFPINKSLWSSSYVLWTSGLSFLVFAILFAFIEIKHRVYWSRPFLLFGKNAMLVYMLHVLFLKVQAIILVHNASGDLVNLRVYLTAFLFNHFSEINASLAYALGYTLFWLWILKMVTQWRLRPYGPWLNALK